MNVYDKNLNEFILNDKNYVAYGGEADIHVINNVAFKIFHTDAGAMALKDKYGKKLMDLSVLKHKSIVAPSTLLFDHKKELCGYTMPFIQSVEPLTKLMAKSYKVRNNITLDSLMALMENMRDVYKFIHKHNIVVVDGNDNNILFRKDNVVMPYFIDVDSYQTKDFSASAYSPIISDPLITDLKHGFSEDTDWYSFAIVTFQLLTNIHPFKGKHPKYTQKQVLDRMNDGVHVFNKEVQLPGSTESFDIIPVALRDWYIEMFSNKFRGEPPKDFTKNAPAKPKEIIVRGRNNITILPSDIAYEEKPDSVFKMELLGNQLRLKKTWNNREIYDPISMTVTTFTKVFKDVAYYRLGPKHHMVVNTSVNTTPKLTHVMLNLPVKCTVLDVAYKNGVLLCSFKQVDGKFTLKIFKMNAGFSSMFDGGYDIDTSSFSECNFVVMDSGVIVANTCDKDLVITHKKADQYKTIKDSGVPAEGSLFTVSGNLLVQYKEKTYQIKVK